MDNPIYSGKRSLCDRQGYGNQLAGAINLQLMQENGSFLARLHGG
ncbi:hypothetical protein PMG71_02075 [Roseofilum sp. BLCC_M154]|uniref:Uncharacterized protein n=1 Tax=Roseofilum acuticapitatum BLCC-M154 TaxID=3022444 RepID=A0ABT7AMT9_9CYAN|nr:hypothetical protein [Roseofilum acuticapitatum]MDJ1168213.1 hypothetical protein [Roseofilum acuticapitatum BLCC-M154]